MSYRAGEIIEVTFPCSEKEALIVTKNNVDRIKILCKRLEWFHAIKCETCAMLAEDEEECLLLSKDFSEQVRKK